MTNNSFPQQWLTRIENEAVFSTNNGLAGAVISLTIGNETIYRKSYGLQRKYNERALMPDPQPMREDTIFDLASLTKIFSTTLAYMMLVEQSLLAIDDTVKKYIPEFSGGDKDTVTIKQLLQHNSGFAPDVWFYDPAKVPPKFYSQSRDKTIALMPTVPLKNTPGTVTVYSDLNFIMLGIILEKITGITQDQFVEKNIYAPLNLKDTGYTLLQKGFPQDRFEASERCGNTRDGNVSFPNIRTKTIQGEVQDETAYYSLGQVAGHAGLFSTAADLTVLCQLILNKGSSGQFKLCSEQTVNLFTQTANIDKSYMLGFQIPSAATHLIYGLLLPEAGKALAHTGWTGKCFVIDFEHNAIILILNNKRHSSVIPLGNNLNQFSGNLLPTSLYGETIQLVYAGILQAT